MADFQSSHENVTLEIEQIPLDEESREIELARLRSEIMAGEGPDVFFLPTRAIQSLEVYFESIMEESLIPDVEQAMRNGLFYDVSEFYDADTSLEKDCLIPGIMDAGVLEGARYVLPLCYNYPAAYVNVDQFELSGLEETVFSSGITHLLNTVVQENIAAYNVQPPDYISRAILNFYPHAIDYDNQKVLLTKDELVDFMESYQAYTETTAMCYLTDPVYYTLDGRHWSQNDGVMHFDNMENAVQQAAIAKAMGLNLGMYPLTAEDGKLVADITFYGAVNADCDHPELAYKFLSTFYSEKNQWGTDAQANSIIALIADGYPVRTVGSASAIVSNFNEGYADQYAMEGTDERLNQMKSVELTDEDVPLLKRTVDDARFPIGLEEDFANIMMNSITPSTTREEMEALAEAFIQKLNFHLGEG